MIERHVSIHLKPGQHEQLEKFIEQEYAPAMARQGGFRGVSLLRESQAADAYMMVIAFDTTELAAAWRATEEHRRLSPQLKELCADSEVRAYDRLFHRGPA